MASRAKTAAAFIGAPGVGSRAWAAVCAAAPAAPIGETPGPPPNRPAERNRVGRRTIPRCPDRRAVRRAARMGRHVADHLRRCLAPSPAAAHALRPRAAARRRRARHACSASAMSPAVSHRRTRRDYSRRIATVPTGVGPRGSRVRTVQRLCRRRHRRRRRAPASTRRVLRPRTRDGRDRPAPVGGIGNGYLSIAEPSFATGSRSTSIDLPTGPDPRLRVSRRSIAERIYGQPRRRYALRTTPPAAVSQYDVARDQALTPRRPRRCSPASAPVTSP